MGRSVRSGSNASSSMASAHTSHTHRSSSAHSIGGRSRSSSIGSSLGFGSLTLQGGSNLSEYAIPTTLNDNEASGGFERLLEDLQSSSVDPRSVRKAACCAALIETARERKATNSAESDHGGVSPNEIFVATLAALSSLQSSLEAKQKSTEDNLESINSDLENTALPLLEILRRILPYVAHPSNNGGALLVHQFGGVSRMLRMFVALGYALPAGGGGGGDASRKRKGKHNSTSHHAPSSAGPNALLRQIQRVSIALLLIAPPSSSISEKEMARLLHDTIVPMFHDARPKVRKSAWGCAMEIVVVAATPCTGDGDADFAKRVQSQRKAIADFLWEYCHAVLTNYSPGVGSSDSGETTSSKLIHVLRFLAVALPYADDGRIRVRFGEGCLKLMDNDDGGKNGGKVGGGGALSVEIIKEALTTLLSCLEMTESEQQEFEDNEGMMSGGDEGGGAEEMSKFAARTLAFLLKHRPNVNSRHSNAVDDVGVVYGRCLLACMDRMLGKEVSNTDDSAVPPSKLLALKLLPNVLTSLLHLCESPTAAEAAGGGGASNGETCASEFNRFVSRTFPIVTSHLNNKEEETNTGSKQQLHRISLEILPQCIPILQQALQIKYRAAWGSILSGGYATFVATLANCLLENKEGATSSGGDDSSDLEGKLQSWIKTLISSLLRLHGDIEKDNTSRTAVEYAVSTVVRGVGVELFLSVVDFVDDDIDNESGAKKKSPSTTGGGIRDDRAWLLPLMKQSSSGTALPSSSHGALTSKTHLSFYQGRVLNLARRCDAASADGHRTAAEISIQKSRVIELWSLFPSFCVHPLDMKENFSTVAKTVVKALGDHGRYPKLIPIVCGGLKLLTIGVMERSAASSPSLDSKEDYDVLSNVSTKILPSLFKLVETLNQSTSSKGGDGEEMEIDGSSSSTKGAKQSSSKEQQNNMQLVEAVTDAIGQLAQICPRDFLQGLFKKVVQRLLLATTEVADNSEGDKNATALRMCSLLGLGQALVASGSLDDASLSLLYRAIRPLVRTDEHDPRVQKRAYKMLAEICDRHKDFVTSDERLSEMIDLLVDSIVTCQVSARHMRLKCMTCIVDGFDSSNSAHMAVIPKIMGEVLLCLKDSNAKTREAAYQLLLAMAVARDDVTDYFRIILAALGAQTTHMRSAAVMALSRLTFEYARDDSTVQSLLPSLMQTVAVLFDDSSREVTKSVIGFVRVSVAAMTPEQLEPLLPEVVGGLMKYNKGKDRFRAKIKIILKKLVRVYGYETIAPLVPEKDTRLITHMRKLSERAARRKAAGVQDGRSVAHNAFDDLMESDEDDSDDGRTFMTGVTGFTKMTAMSGKTTKRSVMDRSFKSKMSVASGAARSAMTSKSAKANGPRIKAELNGEILDLLDASKMARSVRFADVNMNDKDFSDDEDDDGGIEDMKFDGQGRIVISDGIPASSSSRTKAGGSKTDPEHYESDDDENFELKAGGGGGKRRRVSKFESVKIARQAEKDAVKKRKAKNNESNTSASLGAAYKSKKAGGDVKRKGQRYEPYAYVPLNAKDYTKKRREKSVSKMGEVVRNNKRRR